MKIQNMERLFALIEEMANQEIHHEKMDSNLK
jgi:hypothetical protein